MAVIIYAKRLEFLVDKERHSLAVTERMDRKFDLLGSVDAVIDEDFDWGLQRLKTLVREHVSRFVDVRDGKALVTDFKLFFTHCRISVAVGATGNLFGVAETPGPVGSEVKL